jgi:TRAP-type C4-dicarboxylate transport system permease small subunit
MTILYAVNRWLVKIETAFLVLFLSSMILLAFFQVVLRNFFGTGLLWADPLVRHLVIWVGFTGAAIAAHEERHIGIDAFSRFFSERWQDGVRILTSLFAIVVCYYLADAAWVFLVDEKSSGSDFMLNVPTWIALLIIPAGYALMAFHFLVKIAEHLMKLFGKGDRTPV